MNPYATLFAVCALVAFADRLVAVGCVFLLIAFFCLEGD